MFGELKELTEQERTLIPPTLLFEGIEYNDVILNNEDQSIKLIKNVPSGEWQNKLTTSYMRRGVMSN